MNELESIVIDGASNFSFSATKMDDLESTEYTLVTIVVDISGSVHPFADRLLEMLKAIIEACRKSPRAENLMVRVLSFDSDLDEIHGFKMLNMIKTDDYQPFSIRGGMTALYDATYSAIGAEIAYAQNLIKQGYSVNGCLYIITDGEENASSVTIAEIKEKISKSMKQEVIESLLTILIGLNTSGSISSSLKRFKDDAMLTAYLDVGDATTQKLAKLADLVSSSISSSSMVLGTGKANNQSLTL